jgi:thiosulfate reductase/polysulfide reductase chain A
VLKAKLEIKKGTCPVCNYGGCHVRVHIKEGKIIKITGDPESPAGRLCDRAIAAVDYHYHPDRINYPLKRVGDRGEGKWERINWEQAIDEIAERLDKIRTKFGPEAVAVLGGGNLSYGDTAAWKWCNLWGTPNYFWQGKNCGQAEFLAECAIYGYMTASSLVSFPVPGVTKCVLIWGFNPWASNQKGWQNFVDAKKAGAKIVVIDPRFTKCAEVADTWIQLRPGTDGALALGMMNIIIKEGLFDKEFVDRWCIGFDELKGLVQKYPLERVESITWIPKEKIIEIAKLYGTNKPALITGGLGPRHIGRGAALSGVVGKCLLRAISGNLDVEGGQRFLENPEKTAYIDELHMDKLIEHPLRTKDNVSAHVWPMASVKALLLFREAQRKVYPKGVGISTYYIYPNSHYIWSAILENDPYPLRAVFLQTSNPLLVLGNARRIYEALKSSNLDLFVALERWMTPSAQLADYILPSADNLERPFIDSASSWGFCDIRFAREKAVNPLYERRDDYYMWRDLGRHLGQAEYWMETPEQWFDKILEPTGVTFKELTNDVSKFAHRQELKTYERKGFATFSGKVELACSFFEKMGLPALPAYEEPPWSPISTKGLFKEYPLILISGGRVRSSYHSQHKQLEKLYKKYPNPLLQIHPQTAEKLGVAEGDPVYIETPLGRITQKANITTGIDPRVVHADGYWWYPEMPGEDPCLFGVWESNINAILPDDPEVCDYAGNNCFRALLCKVYKAKKI